MSPLYLVKLKIARNQRLLTEIHSFKQIVLLNVQVTHDSGVFIPVSIGAKSIKIDQEMENYSQK